MGAVGASALGNGRGRDGSQAPVQPNRNRAPNARSRPSLATSAVCPLALPTRTTNANQTARTTTTPVSHTRFDIRARTESVAGEFVIDDSRARTGRLAPSKSGAET